MSQEEFKKLIDDLRNVLMELKDRIESHERELKSLKELVLTHELPDVEFVPRAPRLRRYGRLEMRPIPIRNLDRELYENVKEIAEARGLTVGEVVNEALRFYLENYNLAYLQSKRMKLIEKLKELGIPGFIQDRDIKEYLKNLYIEELERVNKRIEELQGKRETTE